MRRFDWVHNIHVKTNAQEYTHDTGPKPMHKDLSSVLTSPITYHIWILKGYSKEPSQWCHSLELPNHMPKPMHTSRYHMYISRYSKEPSRWDNSHELPKHMFKPVYRRTSITCASFSYLATEILCCGYPWESSHETTPMSTQNTCINQCTREHTLTVLANFVITVWYKQVLLIRNVNYNLYTT